MEHSAHLAALQFLLVICRAEEGKRHTVRAERRLNYIRNILLLRFVIKIRHILPGSILVLCQVIIRAVSNPPELTPAKWEQEFNIGRTLAVEAEFLRRMVAQAHLIFLYAEGKQPVAAETAPVLEPFEIRARLAEKFKLHLLKLPCAERKIARSNLVAERFPNLPNTKWHLLPGSPLHIFKVYKNSLCRFRAQVNCILCILGHTLECFKHQVKLADLRKIPFAAARAADFMVLYKVLHFFVAPCIDRFGKFKIIFRAPVLNQFIRPETLVALLAIHQWVGKTAQMAGRYPDLRIH